MTTYQKVLYFVDVEQATSDAMRIVIPRARSLGVT
jgi:hypothetical protein